MKKIDNNLAITLETLHSCSVSLQLLSDFFDRELNKPNPLTQTPLHWHQWNRALLKVRKLYLAFTNDHLLTCNNFSEFMVGAVNVEELHVAIENRENRNDGFLERFTLNNLCRCHLVGVVVSRSVIIDFVQRHGDKLERLRFTSCRLIDDSEEEVWGRAHYPTIIDSLCLTEMIAETVAAVSKNPRRHG